MRIRIRENREVEQIRMGQREDTRPVPTMEELKAKMEAAFMPTEIGARSEANQMPEELGPRQYILDDGTVIRI